MEKSQRNKLVIISIMSYYAKQIFDETKVYEFRKSPLKQDLLNKKIYVYSAKEDKAIIGYFKVSDILKGNIDEILKSTGYNLRSDGHEIVDYYGKNTQNCFALHLYDVTEFEEGLSLQDMRSISDNADMPQYIKFIYENDPLYDVIKEWGEAFSLAGNLTDNPTKTKQKILQKAKMKRRK
ncbi:MAG: hypothetical protein RRY16_01295 [Bacilli bacterium]